MTWFVNRHGLAAFETLPLAEMDRRSKEEGVAFYATLTGLILNEGVQATAISPIAAEELFDGIVALRHGTTTGLDPVDVVSRYYVEALDGVVLPPRVSNDRIRQTYWEDELARTGEREYSVAVLEIPQIEAKLCFKGDRRDEVELQVAEAVRRIHPEEESLYTAIATHDLVLSRGYAKGRPDDAMIAQITDASGQSGFVLGKDSQEPSRKAVDHIGRRPGEDIIKQTERCLELDFSLGDMSGNEGHIERAIAARREAEEIPEISM